MASSARQVAFFKPWDLEKYPVPGLSPKRKISYDDIVELILNIAAQDNGDNNYQCREKWKKPNPYQTITDHVFNFLTRKESKEPDSHQTTMDILISHLTRKDRTAPQKLSGVAKICNNGLESPETDDLHYYLRNVFGKYHKLPSPEVLYGDLKKEAKDTIGEGLFMFLDVINQNFDENFMERTSSTVYIERTRSVVSRG